MTGPVQTTFLSWTLELNPVTTAASIASQGEVDPSCCNACHFFRHSIDTKQFPEALHDFIHLTGGQILSPREVWGSAKRKPGFLLGWWVFAGKIIDGPTSGDERIELQPGFRCGITTRIDMQPDDMGEKMLQVEFEWQGDDVYLEQRDRLSYRNPQQPRSRTNASGFRLWSYLLSKVGRIAGGR